jgi:hypothetical protein
MGVLDETRDRLLARLEELRPLVEEARRIEAALAALAGEGPPGRPRTPMTSLDTLKRVPDRDGDG